MQCPQTQRAFGVALKDLAASGAAPVVLQDCLRWLALRGLTTPRLFQTPVGADKRKLLALRHMYDTGRRPLRSKSCRDKDPHLVANLLLLWLGALPEPLFPAALVPALVESQQSDFFEERVASVRALLKQMEPCVVEALFPLFELLHHYWINQADRDACLQGLGRLPTPAVFGTAAAHELPPEDGGLLSDTVEMLISEYRPLFTQPLNLRRYEADAARQAAAEVQRAEAVAAAAATAAALAPPVLTPIRCERLSVMAPEGSSPFSDCCATPLAPSSPWSACLAGSDAGGAATMLSPRSGAASPRAASEGFRFVPLSELGSPLAAPPPSVQAASLQPGAAGAAAASALHSACSGDPLLEQTLSELLESTVSEMLFDAPSTPAHAADSEAAMDVQALAFGAAAEGAAEPPCGDQPMSPVAVLRDGGDESTDGSDCDVPAPGQHPFAWACTAQHVPAAC